MIFLNDQAKKTLKVIGVVIGILILWGIFNLSRMTLNAPASMDLPQSKNISSSGLSDSSFSLPSGINSAREWATDSSSPEMMMDENSGAGSVPSEPVQTDKKVIKNGNLSLKVEKTEKAAEEISQITRSQGGEVFSTNFYERVKGQKSGSMTIKVPVQKFEETVEKMKGVATQVISESTSGQDVTEQYADLQVQVKNKKAEEESFVKILDRAGKIEDVLAVTQQISRVRGEIERLEGRIRFMDSQTDMSTITVSLSEDIEIAPISNDWRPWQIVKKSFSELIDSMQGFVDGLIRFVIVTVPSLAIFLLIIWIVWKIGKKIFKKIFGQKI